MQPTLKAFLSQIRRGITPVVGICFRADGCQIATALLAAGSVPEVIDHHHHHRPPEVAALIDTITSHQAEAVLLGGPGAFRTDGRLHFGVRALVSELVGDPLKASHALVAAPRLPVPVYAWYGATEHAFWRQAVQRRPHHADTVRQLLENAAFT